jgi:HSP20 family protein
MPLHLIHIIREFTDTGSSQSRVTQSLCSLSLKNSIAVAWEPNADIIETEECVVIRIEIAGIAKTDLTVKLGNGTLTIFGTRKEKKVSDKFYYHQLEVPYGPFLKEILIPEYLAHNDINAHLEEGILEIIISKKTQGIEIPLKSD